jgi:hypothetical protein
VLLVVRLPAPIDIGLGLCSCSGLPLTQEACEIEWLLTNANQGRHDHEKNSREGREERENCTYVEMVF